MQLFVNCESSTLLTTMLPYDQTDHAEPRRPDSTEPYKPGGILLFGYLRKLKVNTAHHHHECIENSSIYVFPFQRMKKKYFILFADTESLPAHLDYFDSEKKWKNGQTAKRLRMFAVLKLLRLGLNLLIGFVSRSIVIKTCFNISRRVDCKHKFVIALYTSEDSFPIAFDSEEELLKWFIPLLKIHLLDKISEGEELKPIYGKIMSNSRVHLTRHREKSSDSIKSTNNRSFYHNGLGSDTGDWWNLLGFYN